MQSNDVRRTKREAYIRLDAQESLSLLPSSTNNGPMVFGEERNVFYSNEQDRAQQVARLVRLKLCRGHTVRERLLGRGEFAAKRSNLFYGRSSFGRIRVLVLTTSGPRK